MLAILGCKEDPPKVAPKIPTLTTTTISSISSVSAVTGGNITSDGGSAVTVRGVCWGTSQNPGITNFKTSDGIDSGLYSSSITGLTPNTTYYVRAYATNSVGTAYGNSVTFITESNIPSILDYVPTGLIHPTLEELLSIPTIESIDSTLVPIVKSISNNAPSISLDVPVALNQVPFLSCAGYAVGYGMMGFLFRIIEGRDHNLSDPFSAHYIWNQLNDQKNIAIPLINALNLVKEQGCSKISFMQLKDSITQPSSLARNNASNYKLTNFYRFENLSIDNMKYYLNKGYPIVIGVNVDKLFLKYEKSKFDLINGKLVLKKYSPSFPPTGHAMLICGYDDAINAFKVLNSFGPEWGENGFFWFDYDFFKKVIRETPPYDSYQIYVGFVKRPVLSTKSASLITDISAQSGGAIYSDWGYNISEKGVCWSTIPDPSIYSNKTSNGAGNESFISSLTGLSPGTKYYVKAYAINSQGPSYGMQVSFTTAFGSLPIAAFTATPTTINAGQSVQFTDQSTNTPTSWSWTFGNGTTITTKNPSHIYSSPGNYTVTLTATNSFGSDSETKTNYITVNFAGSPPVAAFTATPTNITPGQSVQFTDQSTNTPTSWFWNFGDGSTSTTKNPSHIYTSADTYTVILTATNSYGYNSETKTNYINVSSNNSILFNPNLTYGSVTDIDGNVYKTIQIGTQTWMAENLKTTKYRNGDLIGTTTPATLDISTQTNPKYQWAYGGNESNVATYGRLYTWYAATDSRNICPTGWHVPTDSEWTSLTTFLGDESVAGSKLKEAGTSHWQSPNSDATNSSGFTALPSGYRYINGEYNNIGGYGHWWSYTEYSTDIAWSRSISYNLSIASRNYNFNFGKSTGFSVRCVKD